MFRRVKSKERSTFQQQAHQHTTHNGATTNNNTKKYNRRPTRASITYQQDSQIRGS